MKVEKEIKKYLKEGMKEGYNEQQLANYMIKKGIPEKQVKEAERDIDMKWVIIVAILLIVTAASYILVSGIGKGADCSFNKECFADKAQECENVVVRELMGESVIKYSADNCILTKEIERLSPEEPEEAKKMFLGKKMICEYDKGNFDYSLIQSLPAGIERCEGGLKEVFYALTIIEYELLA